MPDEADAADVVHALRGTAAVIKGAAELLQRREDLRPADREELVRMIAEGAASLCDALGTLRLHDDTRSVPTPDPSEEAAFTVRVRGARPSVAQVERALEQAMDDVVIDVRDEQVAEAPAIDLRRRRTDA